MNDNLTAVGSAIPRRKIKFIRLPTRSVLFNCIASVTVEPAPFMYAFGVILYVPVFSYMCMNKLCRHYYDYSPEQCQAFGTGANKTVDINVQKIWAQFDSVSVILGTIPSILFALFIGPWSDEFGRKPPIALPFVGTMLAVTAATLLYFIDALPVWMLLVPNVLQSSLGGMASLLIGSFSYAADISHADDSRTIRITLIEVGMVIGFAAGGIVGGALVGVGAKCYVCYAVSFGTAILGSLYIIIRIKDTRRPGSSCTVVHACTSLFRTKNVVASYHAITAKRLGHARRNLWLLLFALVVHSTISMGEENIIQKFLTAAPLRWSLSYFMSYQAISAFLCMLFVTCFIAVGKKVLGWRDTTLGIIGCLSRIFYSYGAAIATVTWMMYMSTGVGIVKYVVPVAIRSLISKLVPKDEQGKVFSLVSTSEAVSPLIGAVVVTNIFTATTQWWPGFFELISAFTMLVPLVVFCVVDYSMRCAEAANNAETLHDVGDINVNNRKRTKSDTESEFPNSAVSVI